MMRRLLDSLEAFAALPDRCVRVWLAAMSGPGSGNLQR